MRAEAYRDTAFGAVLAARISAAPPPARLSLPWQRAPHALANRADPVGLRLHFRTVLCWLNRHGAGDLLDSFPRRLPHSEVHKDPHSITDRKQ